jgi:hypothetical protein
MVVRASPLLGYALQEHLADMEEVTPTSLDAPGLIHPTHTSASKRASPPGDGVTGPRPGQKRKRVGGSPALVVPSMQVVAGPPPSSTSPQGPSVPAGQGGQFDLRDPSLTLSTALTGLKPGCRSKVWRDWCSSSCKHSGRSPLSRPGTTDLTKMEQSERK